MCAVSLVKSPVVKAPGKREDLLELRRLMAAHEGEFGRAGALLKHGRFYPQVEQRPNALPMGQMGLCYCNCTRARYPYLADDPVPYHYAEGYAFDSEPGISFEHAWLVDLKGHAIDLTWTDTNSVHYFGVTFNDAFVYQAMRETGLFGILCSPSFKTACSPTTLRSSPRSGGRVFRACHSGALARPDDNISRPALDFGISNCLSLPPLLKET